MASRPGTRGNLPDDTIPRERARRHGSPHRPTAGGSGSARQARGQYAPPDRRSPLRARQPGHAHFVVNPPPRIPGQLRASLATRGTVPCASFTAALPEPHRVRRRRDGRGGPCAPPAIPSRTHGWLVRYTYPSRATRGPGGAARARAPRLQPPAGAHFIADLARARTTLEQHAPWHLDERGRGGRLHARRAGGLRHPSRSRRRARRSSGARRARPSTRRVVAHGKDLRGGHPQALRSRP